MDNKTSVPKRRTARKRALKNDGGGGTAEPISDALLKATTLELLRKSTELNLISSLTLRLLELREFYSGSSYPAWFSEIDIREIHRALLNSISETESEKEFYEILAGPKGGSK
jgi:hypothetical protein